MPALRCAAFVLSVCSWALVCEAQEGQRSALVGTVFDPRGGAVANATVSLRGRGLAGAPRDAVTDALGRYHIPALLPGSYDVIATHSDFAPSASRRIDVPVDTTLTLDLALALRPITARLDVSASGPLVDVRHAVQRTRLDGELLQALPTSRSVADLVNLAPGVYEDVAFGGTQGSNRLTLNGLPLTEPELGGPRVSVDYDWLQEVGIVGAGADAEYSSTTGASVVAVLRAGSNRWTGLAHYWTTRSAWSGRHAASLPTGAGAEGDSSWSRAWEGNVEMGGPLRRNRAWIFSGVTHETNDDRPVGVPGPGETRERDSRAVARLDLALPRSLVLEAFATHGVDDTKGADLGPEVPYEASTHRRHPETAWSTRVNWGAGRVLLQAGAAGYVSPVSEGSLLPGGDQGPPPHYDFERGIYTVNAVAVGRENRRVTRASGSLTFYARQFAQEHELKFGVDYEHGAGSSVAGYPGGRLYLDAAGPYLALLGDEGRRFTTSTTAFYAQDSWSLPKRVTLSPGLRVERNLGSVPARRDVYSALAVAPRIGLTWDMAADHRTAARLHYGRYFDPMNGGLVEFLDTSVPPQVLAAVTGPGQFDILSETPPNLVSRIEPGIHHPYSVEWLAGLERQMGTGWSIAGNVMSRRFEDFVGVVGRGVVWAPVSRIDPGPDGVAGTSDDGGTVSVFRLTNPGAGELVETNPVDAVRRYRGVQLVLRSRASAAWQALAAYTWSRLEGTVDSTIHGNAWLNHGDLGYQGGFVDPNRRVNGRSTFDAAHEVKMEGTWHVPVVGLRASGVYVYRSGAAWGRTALFRGLSPGIERVLVEPRGTRRLPAISTLDCRIEKVFPAGGGRSLAAYLDAFNVTNRGVPTAVNAVSGPAFGSVLAWNAPRRIRAGVRFTY